MTEPTRLGRYELLEKLGEGGMGAVWLARLSGTGGFEKLCIVKTVLPSIARDADFVSRFMHEGRVLTQLSHSHIAQVLDMNEDGGQLYLALEYVAGVDVARLHEQVRASGEAMPVSLAVALTAQAAEGLGAAHRRTAHDGTPLNIVHRDVSPHNLMVSYEGEVKVIDFGIARSEARSKHTAQASVMGKLGYMAPEQALGEPLDHRADQYALAIVLWELLANQVLIKRGTLTEMVVAMAHPVVRPLAPLRPEVPASLEAVVQKALSRAPEERFESTDAFGAALHTELLKLGPPPSKAQLGEYVRTRCAAAYTAERQLLTRVSSLRTAQSDLLGATAVRVATPLHAPALTEQVPPPGAATPLAATEPVGQPTVASRPAVAASAGQPTVPVRPPASAEPPPGSPVAGLTSEPPFTTAELAAASPRQRPGRVVAIGVVLLLAVGAALFFAFRQGDGAAVATRAPEVAAAPAGDAGAPAVVVAPAPGGGLDAAVAAPVLFAAWDAGAVVVAPSAPEGAPRLRVVARTAGSSWILSNSSGAPWTGCRLTLPGRRVATLGGLKAGASVELPRARFRVEASAPALEGEARLDCAEGFGLVKAR